MLLPDGLEYPAGQGKGCGTHISRQQSNKRPYTSHECSDRTSCGAYCVLNAFRTGTSPLNQESSQQTLPSMNIKEVLSTTRAMEYSSTYLYGEGRSHGSTDG